VGRDRVAHADGVASLVVPFLGVSASPGEIVHTRVPIGELADGTPVTLPVVVARGRDAGPTLYVQSGQHGDEQTGIETCRTFIAGLDTGAITGTVVAVPVSNVPSHITRTRGFLHEERWLIDMNRVWPGNAGGLLTERIAHVIFTEFVMHADLTIDMHSALEGCDIAMFSSVDPDDDEHGSRAFRERVALSMGTPYIFYHPKRKLTTSDMTRAIANQADLAGKRVVSLEGGQSRLVSWKLVPRGVRALHNAMRTLGMELGEPEIDEPPRSFSDLRLVHAQHGGGLRLRVDIGDEVREGDVLGEIVDVFGRRLEEFRAPTSGFTFRVMKLGAVATGAEVVWIAR
jgi:predicted deacylase